MKRSSVTTMPTAPLSSLPIIFFLFSLECIACCSCMFMLMPFYPVLSRFFCELSSPISSFSALILFLLFLLPFCILFVIFLGSYILHLHSSFFWVLVGSAYLSSFTLSQGAVQNLSFTVWGKLSWLWVSRRSDCKTVCSFCVYLYISST